TTELHRKAGSLQAGNVDVSRSRQQGRLERRGRDTDLHAKSRVIGLFAVNTQRAAVDFGEDQRDDIVIRLDNDFCLLTQAHGHICRPSKLNTAEGGDVTSLDLV